MSRFAKTRTDDLLALLRYAVRRRTSPFEVAAALREVLERRVAPPEVGAAVEAFDATLAAEVRDSLEGLRVPIARFLQATVPADVDGVRVETAWQAAAHALTKLIRLERRPTKPELAQLRKLAVDDVLLEGAQVALATADPARVEENRWFLPLLLLDGGEASLDALLPHVDAALTGADDALEALRPLLPVAPATAPVQRLVERCNERLGPRRARRRG
ncbi:MAG: hypothetical protein JNJ54_08400 [Myxococcaceae bacterium]|nr:hypothetical protein [Myxococcaceae bacterium]